MWRNHRSQQLFRGNYEAPDLGSLLKILNRAENVNTTSCSEIIVHWQRGKNEIVEVYAYDSSTTVTKFDFSKHIPEADALHAPKMNKRQKRQAKRLEDERKRQERIRALPSKQDVILNGAALALQGLIAEKKKALTTAEKPRIRLSHDKGPAVTAALGLYRAHKA
jgi:hypothetical protein